MSINSTEARAGIFREVWNRFKERHTGPWEDPLKTGLPITASAITLGLRFGLFKPVEIERKFRELEDAEDMPIVEKVGRNLLIVGEALFKNALPGTCLCFTVTPLDMVTTLPARFGALTVEVIRERRQQKAV